jgi:hypothetical protein
MSRPTSLAKLAGAVAALAAIAAPSITSAAEVYVYRPNPVRVYRAAPAVTYPVVVVAPVPAARVCTTRVVRVWVDGHYVSRAVRTCR